MDETTWKTVLGSDESKFEIRLGKQRRSILWAKEERDHVTSYQRSVLKFALAPVVLAPCTSGKATSMLKGICRFCCIFSHPGLFQESPCTF